MGVLTVQPHDRTTHITYRVDEFPPRLLLASFMGSSCSVVGFWGGLKCSVHLKILPCQRAIRRPCLSQLVQSSQSSLQVTDCPHRGTENNGQSVVRRDPSYVGCRNRKEQYRCPDPVRGSLYSTRNERMSFRTGTNELIPRRYYRAESTVFNSQTWPLTGPER